MRCGELIFTALTAINAFFPQTHNIQCISYRNSLENLDPSDVFRVAQPIQYYCFRFVATFFEFKGSSQWISVASQHVLCWGADSQQKQDINGLLLCICANNLEALGGIGLVDIATSIFLSLKTQADAYQMKMSFSVANMFVKFVFDFLSLKGQLSVQRGTKSQ